MKKVSALASTLALVMGLGMLSGCSAEEDTSMEYIDVGALAGTSLPQISAVEFGNSDGNSSAAGNSASIANSGSASSDNPISDNMSSDNRISDNSGLDNSGFGSTSSTQNAENSSASGNAQSENKTAEILIPNVTEYGTYIAEYNVFDPEKVKSVLLGDVDITPVIHDYSKDDPYSPDPIYSWENGGTSLSVNNNASVLHLIKEPAQLIRLYFAPPKYNSNGSVDNYEHVNDELDFCTREQAVKNVKETLSKMGITVSEGADVYALCQGDLQKIVDEDIAAGEFYEPNVSWKDPNKKPLTSYTVDKSQEGYYIVFKQEHGGVPVYNLHHSYRSFKDLTMFHPCVNAVYSADGLVLLDVYEYLGNITETGKVTQLISPGSAAQVVTTKYSDMGASRVEFKKMELMYVLAPNAIDGKINALKPKLIPAWVCTVKYTSWEFDKSIKDYGYVTKEKETVLIDAQTGAEII